MSNAASRLLRERKNKPTEQRPSIYDGPDKPVCKVEADENGAPRRTRRSIGRGGNGRTSADRCQIDDHVASRTGGPNSNSTSATDESVNGWAQRARHLMAQAAFWLSEKSGGSTSRSQWRKYQAERTGSSRSSSPRAPSSPLSFEHPRHQSSRSSFSPRYDVRLSTGPVAGSRKAGDALRLFALGRRLQLRSQLVMVCLSQNVFK